MDLRIARLEAELLTAKEKYERHTKLWEEERAMLLLSASEGLQESALLHSNLELRAELAAVLDESEAVANDLKLQVMLGAEAHQATVQRLESEAEARSRLSTEVRTLKDEVRALQFTRLTLEGRLRSAAPAEAHASWESSSTDSATSSSSWEEIPTVHEIPETICVHGVTVHRSWLCRTRAWNKLLRDPPGRVVLCCGTGIACADGMDCTYIHVRQRHLGAVQERIGRRGGRY